MKAYLIFFILLSCTYANAQDTALYNRIESIFAEVNRLAANGKFDTLKANWQNSYPQGTTSDVFLLRQGRTVQKIYVVNNASTARESVIFQNGKPVLRQVQGPSSTWNFYFDGEVAYLYFKEDHYQPHVDSTRFNYGVVEHILLDSETRWRNRQLKNSQLA